MDIKLLKDPEEIEKMIPVIKSAWNAENIETSFKDTIASMRYHGGILLGAYQDDEMVGMLFSYPGYKNGKTYLYSHMTGVKNDQKYHDIGYQLKMKQRDIAQKMGYDLIAWTFDPFNPLNAYFNISKIGAFSRTYIHNFYGRMEDGINRGMRSDRLVAEWWINKHLDRSYEKIDFLNTIEDGRCVIKNVKNGSNLGFLMPVNMDPLRHDPELADEWKNIAEATFNDLFSTGHAIIDYVRKDINYYVFKKTSKMPDKIFDNHV
ncbi:MAG: hypothetical protein ACP5UV_01035 [Thermoplasmata archaeon]